LLSLSALFFRAERRTAILLVLLSAANGFCAARLSYELKTLPAREISGAELSIEARVTDYPELYESQTTVRVRLTGDSAPKLDALLYSFGDELDALEPGDRVRAAARLKTADERYGASFSGSNAEGVYLICYLKSAPELLGKSPVSFIYAPKTLARGLKALVLGAFPEDTAPLMTALLTGDTKLLYEDPALYAAMSEAGVLHVVAVSGMNVAFLVGFISLIVRKKRLVSLVGLPVVWLFVPFAGAIPSVVRAAFMVSTVLMAPLFKRENDGLTALAAILAVLLLLNPASCASVNLQLSFAAMLGMIFVTPRIYQPLSAGLRSALPAVKGAQSLARRALKALPEGICASFAATVGAIIFTVPITVLYFGYVSLIGILVNILIFWAVSACFIGGFVSCFAGFVWLPLGRICGVLTSVLLRYMMTAVKLASAVPYAAVYTQGNLFAWWLALVYIVFLLCCLFPRREGFRPVLPVCLSVIALCCVILTLEAPVEAGTGSISAVDIGQGQSLVIMAGDTTAVIDCGGKGKNTNAGETVAGFLLGRGRRSIGLLMLTHFDSDHVNGVTRLMSRVEVEKLVIPGGSLDKAWRDKILRLAEKLDTEVYIIQESAEIEAGDLSLAVSSTLGRGEPSLIFLASLGNFDALITGDADISEEAEYLAAHKLPDAELFVAGHHGSKYASSSELLRALRAEYALVSCGYNSYGHPTEEALSRFAEAGMTVYRTDLSGTVTFSIRY
ncbi:MAG: ComEC/Rec2 family competence protein, partial [Oscillospiraceae bacterium]|nr:ComEC/Rec2 family competence protein [Oscillospiraceae bacterium]